MVHSTTFTIIICHVISHILGGNVSEGPYSGRGVSAVAMDNLCPPSPKCMQCQDAFDSAARKHTRLTLDNVQDLLYA